MILLKFTVFLTTYISLVSAFYPFVPEWKCKDDGLCVDVAAKRAVDHVDSKATRSLSLEEALTFEIHQRIPEKQVTHEEQLRSSVSRLTNKYASRAAARDEAAGLAPRGTNAYSVVTAVTPTQTNSVGLDQDGTDFSYFCVVNFGSKAKSMYMLMDTGASNTWVMGDSCTTDACSKHNSFGSADSTTYKSTTETFAINYGSGVVNGTYATDTIAFAGLSFGMTFGSAVYTSSDFLNFPMDGILGLGRDTGDVSTFMQTLASAKVLKANVFGVNINRNSDGLKDGEINFGAPDTSKYTGSLGYTAVSGTTGDWVVAVDDVAFNGQKAGVSGKVAYIDTGTSFVFIPPDDAKKLYGNIPGSTSSADGTTYYVPCGTTLPIVFYFSGVGYSISAKDWVGGTSGSLCVSNIYARSLVGNGAWLLGDTFLKNVYAVFDADENRIGFGAKTITTSTSTSVASSTSGSASATRSSTTSSGSAASTSGSMPLVAGGADASTTTGTRSTPSTSTASSASTTTTQGSAAAGKILDTRAPLVIATICALFFFV